jgi:hypothetical protein
MVRPTPNFVILNGSLPEVGRLVAAMVQRATPSSNAPGRIRRSR